MLNYKFEDKIRIWRDIRKQLEKDSDPIKTVLDFVQTLPTTSKKINPWDPSYIVGPWEIWEQSSFTDLDKALLICYSFQLTDRFKGSKIEIHICTNTKNEELLYLVYIDDRVVVPQTLEIFFAKEKPDYIVSQKIYSMPALL